jgi:hypothetical protein
MAKAFEVIRPTTPLTLIEFVLDETGSMNSCRDSTISGFNEYVNAQRNEMGDCLLSLTKFDSNSIQNIYTDKPIKEAPFLDRKSYRPDAMTNLYDAIGVRIRALEVRLSEMAVKPSVLFVIMTDGDDNRSLEYTAASIKPLIKEKEDSGWTFVFLGANQDAWAVGRTFGMNHGNTMTYSTANMTKTMATLSTATTAYRNVRASGLEGANVASADFFGSVNKNK